MSHYDAVIIGAGASGLMCAATAGGRGKKILVVDHAAHAGNKILVSGGGRCNFTNLDARSEHYWSRNPHFAKSALARYKPQDFIDLVSAHEIEWFEKTAGQIFCKGRASEIHDMLLSECRLAGVEIRLGCTIHSVQRDQESRGFRVATDQGELCGNALVVATGGPSWPRLGASEFGYRLAEQFGLGLVATAPGLVPLVFSDVDRERFVSLAGVATPARVSCAAGAFGGNLLFTHRGLSGPSILQISCCWKMGEPLTIDLVPHADLMAMLKGEKEARSSLSPRSILNRFIPRRIVKTVGSDVLTDQPIVQHSSKQIEAIAETFKKWRITPVDTEGFVKAEVTLGGVDTTALSSRTMESRNVPGLYFIGEVVDVTGQLGGFNLHWAWASGRAAGQAL